MLSVHLVPWANMINSHALLCEFLQLVHVSGYFYDKTSTEEVFQEGNVYGCVSPHPWRPSYASIVKFL